MPREVKAVKLKGSTVKTNVDVWMPIHRYLEPQTALCLLAMQKYELERGVNNLNIHFLQGESLIPRARNTIANNFLMGSSEWLLMIDADLTFLNDSLSRLLLTGHKLIGANYAHKTFPIKMAGVPQDTDLMVSPADFIPTGFMLIHRSVFEGLIDEVPVYATSDRDKVQGYFNLYIDNNIYLSEDWSFSKRCKNNGVQGYIDNSIKIGHIGQRIYLGE